MSVVVVGLKGGETKILLDNSSGFQKDFLNKTLVKNVLAMIFRKSGLKKMLPSETMPKDWQKPRGSWIWKAQKKKDKLKRYVLSGNRPKKFRGSIMPSKKNRSRKTPPGTSKKKERNFWKLKNN